MGNVLNELVNNERVFYTLLNLSERWEDEKYYEDFQDYVDVMKDIVQKEMKWVIKEVEGTQKPFGIKFKVGNSPKLHLYLKDDGRYSWLALAKIKNAN